jgi:uncharacterized protein YkwD
VGDRGVRSVEAALVAHVVRASHLGVYRGRRSIVTARAWFVCVLCALVIASGQTVTLAHEQWPAEKRMAQLLNSARDRRDLRTLTHGTRLHRFGRRQVERMVACRCVKHAQPPTWCERWGQAVGVATDADVLFGAFMASPVHRRLLLDPAFRRVGVGARRSGGLLYVAIELCR